MKRALIVGSRGQDGRLLREFLTARGYAVTGLSRQAVELPDQALAGPVDITDPQAVAALVRRTNPQEIYYLAAFHHSSQQTGQGGTQALWSASMAVNAGGPVNFLEAMRQHAQRARFFYA